MSGAIAGTAILESPTKKNYLHTVTLTINNFCSYNCAHCYMHYNGPTTLISQSVIDSIFNSDFKHLAIVGREPLLDSESLFICKKLIALCQGLSRSVSIITNGVSLNLIDEESLKKLSYIDVSFDGGPKTYNKYRKGDFEKIMENVKGIKSRGFKRLNALHVINCYTVNNFDDMIEGSLYGEFDKIMLSPYIKTESYRQNTDQLVPMEEIFQKLTECSSFMKSKNAFILLDVFHMADQGISCDRLNEIIKRFELNNKVKLIPEDPLLHGFIRVTYDGLILSPYDSLHTMRYQSSSYRIYNNSLNTIYSEMLNKFKNMTNN